MKVSNPGYGEYTIYASADIETVVRVCGSRLWRGLGYMAMKAKQIEAITAFVNGKDTFVVLPTGSRTGYGKFLV